MSETPLLGVDVTVRRRSFDVTAAFTVCAGERLALFGPSGAGKTTILESIAGLTEPSAGAVLIDGSTVASKGGSRLPPRARRVALVRQPTTLFPHLTAAENVAYGARTAADRRQVPPLIETLGLLDYQHAPAAALSGGQRQRVALGRALAVSHRVLLLDEPLSALDGPSKAALRDLAIEYSARRGAAALMVTHDLAEAQAFAERLAVVDGGKVLQLGGSHEVVLEPVSRRVAELVGYEGFVPAGEPGRCYAIHPERVRVGVVSGTLQLEGRVLSARAHGPRYHCLVEVAAGITLAARVEEPLLVGDRISFSVIDPPLVAT